jgi:hypothetical protein
MGWDSSKVTGCRLVDRVSTSDKRKDFTLPLDQLLSLIYFLSRSYQFLIRNKSTGAEAVSSSSFNAEITWRLTHTYHAHITILGSGTS